MYHLIASFISFASRPEMLTQDNLQMESLDERGDDLATLLLVEVNDLLTDRGDI